MAGRDNPRSPGRGPSVEGPSLRARNLQERGRGGLKLSGKMSLAAHSVVHADARSLSSRVGKLSDAYQEYDNHIIQWTLSKDK